LEDDALKELDPETLERKLVRDRKAERSLLTTTQIVFEERGVLNAEAGAETRLSLGMPTCGHQAHDGRESYAADEREKSPHADSSPILKSGHALRVSTVKTSSPTERMRGSLAGRAARCGSGRSEVRAGSQEGFVALVGLAGPIALTVEHEARRLVESQQMYPSSQHVRELTSRAEY